MGQWSILDEVINVFEPDIINIGHDEYYSIGLCDKCKGQKGEDLFAGDVRKIYDYLAARRIKTMIWGDKLLKGAYHKEHGFFGGSESIMLDKRNGAYAGTIPATYQAANLVPPDLKILHWLWNWECEHEGRLEDQLLEKGMHVLYGNFEGQVFPDWNERIKRGVKGAVISNWSTLDEMVLQRNGILFGIVYTYFMFWDKNYSESKYEEIRDCTLLELFRYRCRDVRIMTELPKNVGRTAYIEFIHSTDYKVEYTQFADGVFAEEGIYKIGSYIVEYGDGTKAAIPIVYGENISSRDIYWDRKLSMDRPVYEVDGHLLEVSMTTLPVKIAKDTYYRYICANPFPDKRIISISVETDTSRSCSVFLKSIGFLPNISAKACFEES